MGNFRMHDFAAPTFETQRVCDLDGISTLEVGDYLINTIQLSETTTQLKFYEIIRKTNKRLIVDLFDDDPQFIERKGKPIQLSFQGDNFGGLHLGFWNYCKKNYVDININEWYETAYKIINAETITN